MVNKIFGPPGTGKTTELLRIINESDLPLSQIAFVSYARATVKEAIKRIQASRECFDSDLVFFKTQHALNLRQLGVKGKIAEDKLKDFCKEKKKHLSERALSKMKSADEIAPISNWEKYDTIDDEFYAQMQRERIQLLPRSFIPTKFLAYAGLYLKFKKDYFDWLNENDLIDYIGMIERGIEEGVVPPVSLLCVDEWQDITPLQAKQIQIWVDNIAESYHAGDDDQCIHSWAGASPESFLSLEGDERVLERTYRLPSNILALSQALIKRNKNRRDKTITTEKPSGSIQVKGLYQICDDIDKKIQAGESCLFLVRNNFIRGPLLSKLYEHGLPLAGGEHARAAVSLVLEIGTRKRFSIEDIRTLTYKSFFPGGRYFKRGSKKKIAGLVSYEEPKGGYTFEQLHELGLKREFFDDVAYKDLSHLAIDGAKITYYLKLLKKYPNGAEPVLVKNIHEAKGSEADNVVLICDVARKTHDGEREDIEAERRVWYTAITRAAKNLYIADNTDFSKFRSPIIDFVKIFVSSRRS